MPKRDTATSKVYEPPGLVPATSLRADAIARLELLRIVTSWHPQWDTGLVMKAAAELEKFLSSGQAPE